MVKEGKNNDPLLAFTKSFITNLFYYAILLLIFLGDLVRLILADLIKSLIYLIIFLKNLLTKSLINLLVGLGKTSYFFFDQLKNGLQLSGQFFHLVGRYIAKIVSDKVTLAKVKLPTVRRPRLRLPRLVFFSHFSIKVKYFLLGVAVAFSVALIQQGYQFVNSLPDPKLIGIVNYPVSTKILDRNGQLLYEIYRDQNRTPVNLTDLPEHVLQATIAIEDKDFFHHQGVSLFGGIIRAIKDTILKQRLQGGSTITQQLVKSALLTPERTIQRKVKEIILALWTERIFTKEQILEMYLNQVPYGGSSYGIEEASKTYFGKSSNKLTLEEAAFLAGLPQAPSLYSPYSNPELAKRRRDEVLKNMLEQKHISEEEYKISVESFLNVKSPAKPINAPHFVFFVKSLLEKQYGSRRVEEGGLRVTTSLDLTLQKETEAIVKEEIDKIKRLNVTNGGVLVTKPSTGEILAMVGSQDYFALPTGAFNVTTAQRQPGSAIKPVMYSLALENGYTAASVIDDSPVVFHMAGAKPYKPVNYDGRFHGIVPLRYALANSYNVPAVKVLNTLGVDNFIAQAERFGITTWDNPQRFGLSLTLGGGEVKMTEMAQAFAVFANYGQRVDLNPILKIVDHADSLIYQNEKSGGKRVLSEEVAFIISDILADNFARRFAFGLSSTIEIPGFKVAVKTGTSNDKRDNWTIGYTPSYLVTVWVGNNDNSPMNPYLSSGITGASPIWNRVMSYVLKTYSDNPGGESLKNEFWQPGGLVKKVCYFGREEYFLPGTENTTNCKQPLFNLSPTPTP